MHYTITARFKLETAAEFYRRLTDGTIENQKPDGKEIVASMRRAKIDHEGVHPGARRPLDAGDGGGLGRGVDALRLSPAGDLSPVGAGQE